MATSRDYRQWIDYIYSLVSRGIKYDLVKITHLLERLALKEHFPLVIHVLGTNGKGSVSSMTAAGLRASGYKTGLFTSPHLTRILERFRIDDQEVSEQEFCVAMDELYPHIEAMGQDAEVGYPSFFEIMTALGMIIFRRAGCNAVVLEAGLGGRLDATNACRTHITVITNVDYDHTKTLGSTLRAIAGEKAGAMRPGIPLVTNEPRPGIRSFLRKRALELGADYILAGRRMQLMDQENCTGTACAGTGFPVRVKGYSGSDMRIRLAGQHQLENGSTALCVLETLADRGWKIDLPAALEGLLQAAWPGRLELVEGKPQILLDGAHNISGARALGAYLRRIRGNYSKINCLMGVLGDKDARGLFSEILPYTDRVVLSKPANWRALDPALNLELAREFQPDARVVETPSQALEELRTITREGQLLLVCGSLYLVGEIRGLILGIEPDPVKLIR